MKSTLNINELRKLYFEENMTMQQIADKLNTCKSSIASAFRRHKIEIKNPSQRKQIYKVNEDTFESIDSKEKAYWLGFLYADGSNTTKKHEVKLSLQESDLEIVEKFKEFMGYTGPLAYRVYKDKYPTWSNQWSCLITNKKISQDLFNLGMLNNKTYTLRFPSFLEEQYISHFIRGFFDGDGCISSSKNIHGNFDRVVFSIVANLEFLDDLQKIFIKTLGLSKTLYKRITNNNSQVKSIVYGGHHQLIKIREYLYKDATIYLARKKEKFDLVETHRERKKQYL